jgi:hypothetical protein
MMIPLSQNKESFITTRFRVDARDFMHSDVLLPLETIKALNKAAQLLQEISSEQYEIMLVRGCIHWNHWRKLRGVFAKILFYLLYWNERSAANLLFNSNGHEDGFSVDILPFDVRLNKTIRFLSWKNIMIRQREAENILKIHNDLISLIDRSMSIAGFTGHPDPREKLQMHYRLRRIAT